MPNDGYIRQWSRPSLVQIMDCRLFGANPLSEPMLAFHQLDHWEQISFNLNQNATVFIPENQLETVVYESQPLSRPQCVNTSRSRQNGCHFADDTSKCIFMNEEICISIQISLKFVAKGPISSKSALVQVMAWCRTVNSIYMFIHSYHST